MSRARDSVELASTSFTVAIATLNRLPYVGPAISAVLFQLAAFPQGRLIVVDNGSTDGTMDYLKAAAAQDPRLTVLSEARRGAYFARATAIAQASGAFLIFLDDDALPHEGWLEGMITQLAGHADIGAVGGSIDPIWEIDPPAWLSRKLTDILPVYDFPEEIIDCGFPCYPPTISLGIRLNECSQLYIGPERLRDYPVTSSSSSPDFGSRLGGEDTDLCEIYHRNGFRVVMASSIRVSHRVPKERLSEGWFMQRFAGEGHIRIRLLRVAGYSIWGPHGRVILLAFPMIAILRAGGFALPRSLKILIDAYYSKCLGAWREVLFGPRIKPLPYEL